MKYFKFIVPLIALFTVGTALSRGNFEIRSYKLNKPLTLDVQLGLLSNYIWRGVSQTHNRPALQGQLELITIPGFYTSIWGSNVSWQDSNSKTANTEIQYTLGFSHTFRNFGIDLGTYYYTYPGAVGLNYFESFMQLNYESVYAGIAYAPNVFNSRRPGLYYALGFEHEFSSSHKFLDKVTLGGEAGFYDLSGPMYRRKSYWNWGLLIRKSFRHFAIELDWTDTNRKFERTLSDDSHIVAKLLFSSLY